MIRKCIRKLLREKHYRELNIPWPCEVIAILFQSAQDVAVVIIGKGADHKNRSVKCCPHLASKST